LISFVRSGNTLSRGYLESILGLWTGSDQNMKFGLVRDLYKKGFKGEGFYDKKSWIVKSHYPETAEENKYQIEKALFIVRNPVDAIISFFNMTATQTHDMQIFEEDYHLLDKIFKDFVEQEVTVYRDFNNFWLKQKIPVHLMRFEDILLNPMYAYTEAMKFIFGVTSIEGTVLEKHINMVCGGQAPKIYEPKGARTMKNYDRYSKEQIDFIYETCKDLIKKFGYEETFTGVSETDQLAYIKLHNKMNFEKMLKLQESDAIVSITMNEPLIAQRQPQAHCPKWRDHNKFIDACRGLVRTIDKAGKVHPKKAKLEDLQRRK